LGLLWYMNNNSSGDLSLGSGGLSGGSGAIDTAATVETPYIPPTYGPRGRTNSRSETPTPTPTKVYKQDTRKNNPPANANIIPAVGQIFANTVSANFQRTPAYQRATYGILSGGLTEVVGLSATAAAQSVRPPWWAVIFPPITYPIGLAVATHNAEHAAGSTNVSSEGPDVIQSLDQTNIRQKTNKSNSITLANAGATTPRTGLTAAALAQYPQLSGFSAAELSYNTILYANRGVLRQHTADTMLRTKQVRAGTLSAFDAYGGALAFPQGRAGIEGAADAFYWSRDRSFVPSYRGISRTPTAVTLRDSTMRGGSKGGGGGVGKGKSYKPTLKKSSKTGKVIIKTGIKK
jgi:hypothetical protein